MKKFFFPTCGKTAYKANLHCHTTFSDGRLTPENVKREYMARGYSIVAYTDHEIPFVHSDLKDKDFDVIYETADGTHEWYYWTKGSWEVDNDSPAHQAF